MHMHRQAWYSLLFVSEIVVVFGAGIWALDRGLIDEALFFLFMTLAGLIFALFYGIKGSLAAVGAAAAAGYWSQGDYFPIFLSRHYLPASFYVGGLLIAGMVRSAMDARVIGAELSARVLNQRLDRLTVEVSEKDHALQEAFQKVLTDTESPPIVYQALRRIEGLKDREAMFEEVLQLLYQHCHVEKSGLFEPLPDRGFRRVAVFGPSQLPETLAWDWADMPEILRVVRQKREVIVPTAMDHRLAMAVPIIGRDDRLHYVLLIEEIRFINFNDRVVHLIKLVAFWLKYLIEERLAIEERLPYSQFETVIVYRTEVARRLLRQSLAGHRRYRLPYALLRVSGRLGETEIRNLASRLRIYDELFLMSDDQLWILLSMIQPQYVAPVKQRLAQRFPEHRIEVLGKRRGAHGA